MPPIYPIFLSAPEIVLLLEGVQTLLEVELDDNLDVIARRRARSYANILAKLQAQDNQPDPYRGRMRPRRSRAPHSF